MIGSRIFYRIPTSTGWCVLQGIILDITDTAVVVRERFFGGQSTIDPNWLVSYAWSTKPDCADEESTSDTSAIPSMRPEL